MADILSVSQLNRYVKSLLDGDSLLKDLLLRGEISNFVCHQRSGHCYFTLKEGDCAVRAVMFSRYANDLLFEPENGMAVILRGAVSLYERDGSYQLYVYDMQPDGRGALQVAFEQLYRKLDRQGLFSQQNKQPIPTDARRIGVVTSASGAAFWDIVNVLSRRYPLATLVFCPAQVQGEAAAQALDVLEQQGNCDVIILGRGGGSMEDLWCFNDEQLVRRVARCTVPLISAVGHETDFTLCDYAADLRAPTPSAAAELAVPDRAELLRVLLQLEQRCQSTLQSRFAAASGRLERAGQQLSRDMTRRTLTAGQTKLEAYQKELEDAARSGIQKRTNQLRHAAALADSLSPYRVLGRGYAMVYDSKNRLCSADALSTGDRITLRGAAHTAECTVLSVEELNESTQKL